jgi:hypothetical protein
MFFFKKEEIIRKEEKDRATLSMVPLEIFADKYKKIFNTYMDVSKESHYLGLLLFYMGCIDFAATMERIRYEFFLDMVYEFFGKRDVSEIVTEMLIEFHINRECSEVAESIYLEGRNRYNLWSGLKDREIFDWQKGFIKDYVEAKSFPTTIQKFYILINRTDVKAEYLDPTRDYIKPLNKEIEFKLPPEVDIEDLEI